MARQRRRGVTLALAFALIFASGARFMGLDARRMGFFLGGSVELNDMARN